MRNLLKTKNIINILFQVLFIFLASILFSEYIYCKNIFSSFCFVLLRILVSFIFRILGIGICIILKLYRNKFINTNANILGFVFCIIFEFISNYLADSIINGFSVSNLIIYILFMSVFFVFGKLTDIKYKESL